MFIFFLAADGSVTVLFPNSQHQENKVDRGKIYEFPPPESKIRLQAMFLPAFSGKKQ